jgi:hypothetical protein
MDLSSANSICEHKGFSEWASINDLDSGWPG